MTPKKTTDTGIHTRALLIWLTISVWTARKFDRKISDKVNTDLKATKDAGRWNKFLLPGDAKSYKGLVAASGALRQWHYDQTLAWADEGWRLLPTANFQAYADGFREHKATIRRALDAFIAEYPTLQQQSARLLGDAYNPADFPPASEIRDRFKCDVSYSPLPMDGDIRVNLADDQIAAIESTIKSKIHAATETAVQDAWTRLYDVVERAYARIADPDAVFRDSLIINVRECCDILKRLNVTNDPQLESMRAKVSREIAGIDPDTLRDTDTRIGKQYRADVANKADAILKTMSGLFARDVA